jgi:DNA polymerase
MEYATAPAAHVDFETRALVNLPAVGPWVYFEHPLTDAWCCSYAIGDAPVRHWLRGEPCPRDLADHIEDGFPLIAHNAMGFERICFQLLMGPRYGWPVPRDEQWHCTAALAAAMALPRALEQAAAVMSTSAPQKDKEGAALMRTMMKPRAVITAGEQLKCEACKGKGLVGPPRHKTACDDCVGLGFTIADADKIVWWDDPELIQRLAAYCDQDVETERGLHSRCRPLSVVERAVFLLDGRANARGITVDVATVLRALDIVKEQMAALSAELYLHTNGAVGRATEIARLTEWLVAQGIAAESLESLDKYAVRDLLAFDLPPNVRRVIEIRAEGSKSSVGKLQALLDRVSADGRMRDNLLIYGASTGRWSGRGAQLQNLPRPGNIKNERGERQDVQNAIALLADPRVTAETIDLLYGPPLAVISECLRGMLLAAPGYELVVADFNAIEARVNAWLAHQGDLLELFRSGADPYCAMAAKIYGRPAESFGKDSRERQLGKKVVLGCGYQMGWQRFRDSCAEEGIVIDDDTAKAIIKIYRAANDKIVQFWRDLQDAALDAVDHPGEVFGAGQIPGDYGMRINFVVRGSFLWVRLPSGRLLAYARPHTRWREIEIEDSETGELIRITRRVVAYWGVDATTKQWVRQYAYGGFWCENVTQATARDLMASAMLRVEAAGYPVILTIHDEIIAEVPAGFGDVREFERLMCDADPWAEGCPIKAEGWRGTRLRKGG